MSFSFGFELDSSELDEELANLMDRTEINEKLEEIEIEVGIEHSAVDFATLLATLPPLISYTPVTIPLLNQSSKSRILLRRDLFDARFQLIAQDEDQEKVDMTDMDKGKGRETFVEEESDLVVGIYEGGLKTWECSLDLVDCLCDLGYNIPIEPTLPIVETVRGKSFLELGCGTALPTCAIFARLLEEIRINPTDPASTTRPNKTQLHLQDYNHPVLSLITLPNILLTFAQHLANFTSSPPTEALSSIAEDSIEMEEDVPTILPGELEITPEFLELFENLIELENIEFGFFAGNWSGMVTNLSQDYDVVLTSETIYSLPSLPSLLDLLKASCKPTASCLVACKRIYFGVGGGQVEFTARVNQMGGRVETIYGGNTGVGRIVMSVQWS